MKLILKHIWRHQSGEKNVNLYTPNICHLYLKGKIIRPTPDLCETRTCNHSTADNIKINMLQESLKHIDKTPTY